MRAVRSRSVAGFAVVAAGVPQCDRSRGSQYGFVPGVSERHLDRWREVRSVGGSRRPLSWPPPHESPTPSSCGPRMRCLATPARGAGICPDEPTLRCVLATPELHASVSSAGLALRSEGRPSPVGLREGTEPIQLVGEVGRDSYEST